MNNPYYSDLQKLSKYSPDEERRESLKRKGGSNSSEDEGEREIKRRE
jgi:hypothetical protein